MSDSQTQPGQWISFTGSGNNVAVGAGARAGNTSIAASSPDTDVSALLAQIRRLAEGLPDHAQGEQAAAAVSAIEADLAKPPSHRFSVTGALAVLTKLGETVPVLAQLVDAVSRAVH